MRKTITSVLIGVLVAAALSTAAQAKPVGGSYDETLAPFPKLAAWGDPAGVAEPSCLSGQSGVNWDAHDFTAPANGTLMASMKGFTGDWDLFILNDQGDRVHPLAASVNDQATAGAAAEEEVTLAVKKGQKVQITPCNWAGGPQATATYMFMPAKKK
ncbi:MAG: hypothetical protein QOF16_153 [Actinomycetota bacterium]|jgi:hypothetical protein|nr:hypothetical protein [Actinomycetota bacterium]MEA2486499.1 hypothetical protein [Actinomycetota bacterium]